MKRELGDIMWYWTTACASLDLDPFEVISENQKKKLEARYGEKFEVERSEIRKRWGFVELIFLLVSILFMSKENRKERKILHQLLKIVLM